MVHGLARARGVAQFTPPPSECSIIRGGGGKYIIQGGPNGERLAALYAKPWVVASWSP